MALISVPMPAESELIAVTASHGIPLPAGPPAWPLDRLTNVPRNSSGRIVVAASKTVILKRRRARLHLRRAR